MATSYFDLAGTIQTPTQPEVAQAGQDALVGTTGPGRTLAVRPRLDLRAALERALRRQEATSALGVGERRLGVQQQQVAQGDLRLALGEQDLRLQGRRSGLDQARVAQRLDQLRYEQGQEPYTIGLGALSGGLGVYRGYNALQKEGLAETRAREQLAMQQDQQRQLTASAERQVSLLQAIKRQNELVGIDPSATSAR